MMAVASEHADLDCGGCDRLAARLHRAECAGADEAGADSVLRSCVCVSRTARRSDQGSWFDGDGLCLFAKRLERGRFVWPQAASGTVSLTRAQLSMLLEGIDWRRPERTWEPQLSDRRIRRSTRVGIVELCVTAPARGFRLARWIARRRLRPGSAALTMVAASQPRPRFATALRPAFFGAGATVLLRPRPIFFARVERVSA